MYGNLRGVSLLVFRESVEVEEVAHHLHLVALERKLVFQSVELQVRDVDWEIHSYGALLSGVNQLVGHLLGNLSRDGDVAEVALGISRMAHIHLKSVE